MVTCWNKVMAESDRKYNLLIYWTSLFTLLLVSPITFGALFFRTDRGYTPDDALCCGLLFLWNIFLVYSCIKYPATYLRYRGHIKSAMVFGSLAIFFWFLTMILAVVLIFVSPYFRENAICVFCGVLISVMMVTIALYLFFSAKPKRDDEFS